MDGWITIGTKLDSKQLERDLINHLPDNIHYDQ
jgi:hypothetical protein